MNEYLAARRVSTETRIGELRAKLGDAETTAGDVSCVYLTGSFGRGEASSHSDVDIFIVGRTIEEQVGKTTVKRPALSRLNEICIKADLIDATRALGIPDFDGDGAYLLHYTVRQLIDTLGHSNDDASNTFTARLLMLLESRSLLGEAMYAEAIDQVIAAYWGEFEEHKNDFVPGFLVNDILRLWRTFCVNYEARTSKDPSEKKAKRKLKNYKLKHSRLLTCYSGLAYLLATFAAKKTVTPADAKNMVALPPIKRLETLVTDFAVDASKVERLLASYERFLRNTDDSETVLVERFIDPKQSGQYLKEANEFGDAAFDLLAVVGANTRLHRLLVV